MLKIFEQYRRPLYPDGPLVSFIGFGTYRVGFDEQTGGYPDCCQALYQALQAGVNLVDTSSNYTDGQAERLVGQVLKDVFQQGLVNRDQVVVITKAGYVQGQQLQRAAQLLKEGRGFPEMITMGPTLWHGIHPVFLRDQLLQSLDRLGLSCVDVFLLHNPEYLLKNLEFKGVEKEAARTFFYQKIEKAFEAMESFVQEGLIKAYGISSNSFGFPDSDPAAVSVERCVQVADSVAKKISPKHQHHFKLVQMPLNWVEAEAAVCADSSSADRSALAQAHHYGLGAVINRPFNALCHDGLIRLTRPNLSPQHKAQLNDQQQEGLRNWDRLAQDLEKICLDSLDFPGYEGAPLSQLVLAVLTSLPFVSSVLCGMRKPQYVQDAQTALSLPRVPHAHSVLASVYENLEFHPR